jgi:chromosomal replication initiator protein
MMAATDTVATLWQEITNKVNADDRLERNVLAFLGLAEPKGVLGDTLYIEVPNELTRQMLDTRIRPAIVEALHAAVDNQGAGNFAVFVNPEISVPVAAEPVEEPVPAATASLPSYLSNSTSVGRSHETRLNPKYNFDNFVTGSSNRFANAAAFAVAETPAKGYNPLFILSLIHI